MSVKGFYTKGEEINWEEVKVEDREKEQRDIIRESVGKSVQVRGRWRFKRSEKLGGCGERQLNK